MIDERSGSHRPHCNRRGRGGSSSSTLVAYAALKSSRKNGDKADAVSAKVDAVAVQTDAVSKKTDAVAVKAEEIHTLTNSTLSATTQALADAKAEIVELKKMIGFIVNPPGKQPLP